MIYFNLVSYILVGLIAITFIDTIGAIASRKYSFKYSYLSLFSFAVYIVISFFVSKGYNVKSTLFASTFLGLYDGTLGFWFSIILRANNGLTTEQASEMLGIKSAMTMIMISLILAIIGYGIANI